MSSATAGLDSGPIIPNASEALARTPDSLSLSKRTRPGTADFMLIPVS